MAVFIALYRGINVGGKNPVKMESLRRDAREARASECGELHPERERGFHGHRPGRDDPPQGRGRVRQDVWLRGKSRHARMRNAWAR